MSECKNPTCTASTKHTYCSRRCQIAMRTVTGGRHLPDVWVSQDTGRAIARAAETRGMSVRDWIVTVLEIESDAHADTLF